MWCDACRWNYTHITKDCNHLARIQREQQYNRNQSYRAQEGGGERALVPVYPTGVEQPRPVLGNQPPPLGTTPLRYVNTKDRMEGLELVPTQDYDYDEDLPLIDLSQDMVREQGNLFAYTDMDMNQLMYVSSQGNRGYGQ